jgi:ankyrin repeat protein
MISFQWALTGEHIQTCQFLIQAGANLDHENDFGVTTAHEVSERILLYEKSSDFARALGVMFSFLDHSELWGLGYLHRVILGILPLKLEEVLQDADKAEVNCVDSRGRTPAHWAAHRGDASALKSLLQHGANVKAQDFEGSSLLHAALKSGRMECVETLLLAGCDANIRDHRGWNSIHLASRVSNDTKLMRLLLLAGGSPHNRSKDKSTPLQTAACHNQLAVGRMLIDHGVDIDAADRHGDNIIFETIYCHHTAFLEMILEHTHRLDWKHRNVRGRTVLHVVALFADLPALEALAMRVHSLPPGLDCDLVDSQGRTARECLESRTDVTEDIREAFEALLTKCRGSENSSLYEVFVDCYDDEKLIPVD